MARASRRAGRLSRPIGACRRQCAPAGVEHRITITLSGESAYTPDDSACSIDEELCLSFVEGKGLRLQCRLGTTVIDGKGQLRGNTSTLPDGSVWPTRSAPFPGPPGSTAWGAIGGKRQSCRPPP